MKSERPAHLKLYFPIRLKSAPLRIDRLTHEGFSNIYRGALLS
jgi:hypothetical protein